MVPSLLLFGVKLVPIETQLKLDVRLLLHGKPSLQINLSEKI